MNKDSIDSSHHDGSKVDFDLKIEKVEIDTKNKNP